MQSLRPSLKMGRIALAALFCLTLAFVALTSSYDPTARFFWGLFSLAIAGSLFAVYSEETEIAENHIVVCGMVEEVQRGPRGRCKIKYSFAAINGQQYKGTSEWGAEPVGVGTGVSVLYKTLDPAVNQPLKRFLFYSFDPSGN